MDFFLFFTLDNSFLINFFVYFILDDSFMYFKLDNSFFFFFLLDMNWLIGFFELFNREFYLFVLKIIIFLKL